MENTTDNGMEPHPDVMPKRHIRTLGQLAEGTRAKLAAYEERLALRREKELRRAQRLAERATRMRAAVDARMVKSSNAAADVLPATQDYPLVRSRRDVRGRVVVPAFAQGLSFGESCAMLRQLFLRVERMENELGIKPDAE